MINKIEMSRVYDNITSTVSQTGIETYEEFGELFLQFLHACGFYYIERVDIIKQGEE